MKQTDGLSEFSAALESENRLIDYAARALDGRTRRTRARNVQLLLVEAVKAAPIVEVIEYTADPQEIARALLHFAVEDNDLYWDPTTSYAPNDPHLQRLENRQRHLPEALAILEMVLEQRPIGSVA
jgi:hypothetical protein